MFSRSRFSIVAVVLGIVFLSLGSTQAQTNTFPSTGNVGIGTASPISALHIEGAGTTSVRMGAANSYLYESAIQTRFASGLGSFMDFGYYNGSATFYPALTVSGANGSQGYIGVGTTAPGRKLDLEGTAITGAYTPLLRVGTNDIAYFGSGGGIELAAENNSGEVLPVGVVSAYLTNGAPGQQSGDLLLSTSNAGVVGERLRIKSTGNVGIGTAQPGATLEVNGNVKLTSGSGGSITFSDGSVQSTAWTGVLCGGDYAESVDVAGERTSYEPGDVLIIDPKNPGRFAKSAEPYSTAVTGVYSTKPGAIGRRQTAAKNQAEVPMAMIGIVPTKVTTENGPINPGDILVSSSTSGRAMKGTNRSLFAGAVIGKALGSLDSGTGVIEVVVSLQ